MFEAVHDRLGTIGVTAGFLGAALVLLLSALYGSSNRSPMHQQGPGTPPIHRGVEPSHVNEIGGYAFQPPVGWTVRDRGSSSLLRSPDADVAISFGTGRSGPLRVAAGALLDSIRRTYPDVRVGPLERSHVDRRRAVVVSGRLRNGAGVRVRFLGLALRVGGENRVIAVFVSQSADPAHVLPVVEEAVSSFRPA